MNQDDILVVLTISGPIDDDDQKLIKDNNWNYLESHKLTGEAPVVDIVVLAPLAHLAITSLTSIIEKHIENKRFIKIKVGDVEIENAKLDEICALLKLINKKKK